MVGGACYLIDTGNTRVLIDFGLFYGLENEGRNAKIEFDPSSIDYVLLTHAHVDHSGRIPMLYKHGFKGKVLGTDATKSLAGVMLEMSLGIGEEQGKSIYSHKDLFRTLDNFTNIPYDHTVDLSDDISIRFSDAGHIMGSSIIELWIRRKDQSIKIVATGDIGSSNIPLLKDPTIISEGDFVLIESTYGSTKRYKINYEEFGVDIQNTINSGGSVLIPAFVLEKTQKILYVIGQLKSDGIISNDVPVFSDSSTAHTITKLYRKYTQYYDAEAKDILSKYGDPLSFPYLYEVSGKSALRSHDRNKPAIYLTSSGMLDHANSPKHLELMIENPKNLLAIVGWQAPDSLGRQLQDGASSVIIPIEKYENGNKTVSYVDKQVKMRVKRYGMFSSHMDACDALKWLSHFSKVKEVFVVHGEKENTLALSREIKYKLGFNSSAPAIGDKVYLRADGINYYRRHFTDLCNSYDDSYMLLSIADQ
jgi:metallo-beta-lactamase family protein